MHANRQLYIGAFVDAALTELPEAEVRICTNPSGISLSVHWDSGCVGWQIGNGCWDSCGAESGRKNGKECADILIRESPKRDRFYTLLEAWKNPRSLEYENDGMDKEIRILRATLRSLPHKEKLP